MHAGEIETGIDLVARLISGQFPQWRHLAIRTVPSFGTDNAMFRLGEELVVRLPRIDWAVEGIGRECLWLPRLAPYLPVSVPVPIGKGSPAGEYPYPWSVYRWLDGETPAVDRLDEPKLLALQLGDFVSAMRRIELSGGPAASRDVPLAARDFAVRTAIEELGGIVDTRAVTNAWQDALRVPEWTEAPVWVHGDLAPGNLLLVGDRLSAVIDFSSVGVGDPACDLMVAWNLLPPAVRPVFRAASGADEATWARGRGWALAVALVQLPYYRHSNPKLAANARHVIHEVLNE